MTLSLAHASIADTFERNTRTLLVVLLCNSVADLGGGVRFQGFHGTPLLAGSSTRKY